MTNRSTAAWIALGSLATVVAVGLFVALQQHLRSDANHPQMEMARAAASRLSSGASPTSVVPPTQVDIGRSPDSYVIVVDAQHRVLASSAELAGDAVVPPGGVFDFVRDHGEDVITWQPAAGVRSAIVVEAFQGGYVVVGRSLADTEAAESRLPAIVLACWAAALAAIAGAAVLSARLVRP